MDTLLNGPGSNPGQKNGNRFKELSSYTKAQDLHSAGKMQARRVARSNKALERKVASLSPNADEDFSGHFYLWLR